MADLDTSKALASGEDLRKLLQSQTAKINSPERRKDPGLSEAMRVSRPLQLAAVPENLTARVIDFDRKTAGQKHLHNPVNNRIVSRVPKEIAVAASLAASPVAAANLQQKAPERAPVVHNPVNNRIVSRVPKEIAVAASLAASPVAAANLQQKAPERAPVVHKGREQQNCQQGAKEIAVAASLAASPSLSCRNLQPERAPVVHNHGDIKNEYKFEMHIHGADSKQIPEIKDEMEKLIKKHMAEAERKRRLEDKRQLMDRSKGGAF